MSDACGTHTTDPVSTAVASAARLPLTGTSAPESPMRARRGSVGRGASPHYHGRRLGERLLLSVEDIDGSVGTVVPGATHGVSPIVAPAVDEEEVAALFRAFPARTFKTPVLVDGMPSGRDHPAVCTSAPVFNFPAPADRIKSKMAEMRALFPPGYAPPSLREAAEDARFFQSERIVDEALAIAKKVPSKLRSERGLSLDEAAVISLYTFDFGEGQSHKNPASVINTSLFNGDIQTLHALRGILYLLLAALRKLEPVRGLTLYRSVAGHIKREEYRRGNTVTWSFFSSARSNPQDAEEFTVDRHYGEHAHTLFKIYGGWGYDIQPFTQFPEANRILLEPGVMFSVWSVRFAHLSTIVELEMQACPLFLADTLPPATTFFPEGAVMPTPETPAISSSGIEMAPHLNLDTAVGESNLNILLQMIERDVTQATSACTRICCLATEAPFRKAFFEHKGAAEVLVASLRKYNRFKTFISACLRTIFTICGTRHTGEPVSERRQRGAAFASILQDCILLLILNENDPDLLATICSVVRVLCVNEKTRARVAVEGGIRYLLDVLNKHYKNVAVAEHGIGAIQLVCLTNDENQDETLKAGGIASVIRAMKAHENVLIIAEYGCGALRTLVTSDERIQNEVARVGGISVLIDAIKRFPNSAPIAEHASATLSEATISNVHNQSLVAHFVGIETIIKAMRIHEKWGVVIEHVCAALWETVQSHEANTLYAIQHGAIASVSDVLRRHYNSAPVAVQGCGALMALGLNPSAVRLIMDEGGLASLVICLWTHTANASVVEFSLLALSNIAAAAPKQVVLALQGRPAVIQMIKEKHHKLLRDIHKDLAKPLRELLKITVS